MLTQTVLWKTECQYSEKALQPEEATVNYEEGTNFTEISQKDQMPEAREESVKNEKG